MTANALARSSSVACLRLKFLDFRIDVETNSLSAATRLKSYFEPYLWEGGGAAQITVKAVQGEPVYDEARMEVWSRPSQPDRLPKESFYESRGRRFILKNRTGVLITLSDGAASLTGDIKRHLPQVVNLIGTMFGVGLLDQGYAMLHASAVVAADTDRATIFLGNSGSGKSSLALQLIERGGYDFVSNDRVLLKVVRGEVRVVGLPKKPRVNPGTLLASASLSKLLPDEKRPLYEGMSAGDLWRIEDKTDVDVAHSLGARERLDGVLARAYSLEWRPSGTGLVVEVLQPDEALAAMRTTAKDFGPFDLRREERDMDREFRRISRACAFTAVGGRADPKGFAKRLATTSA